MTPKPLALALLLALVASACATTQEGDAQSMEGCYYFQQDETARELNLPWGVRLTTDSLTGWPPLEQEPGVYEAVTLRGPDRTTRFPFGFWQSLPGDSVRIGYPGSGGFSLDLAVESDALVGVAVPVGDAGLGPRTPRAVRLDRARCPEQPPA